MIDELGLDQSIFTKRLPKNWYLLPTSEYRKRWGEAFYVTAQEFHTPGLAARLAEKFPAGSTVLDVAMRCAPNLYEAFLRHGRYYRMACWEVQAHADIERKVVHIELPPPVRPEEPWCAPLREVSLATLLQTGRAITGFPLQPRSVSFTHARPHDTRELEVFFHAPIRFGARSNEMVFSLDTMVLPLPDADPQVSEAVTDYLDRLLARCSHGLVSIEERVYHGIRERLDNDNRTPNMDEVAKALGMSEPTLRRRLAMRRLSFEKVVERVRSDLARDLLVNSQQPLTEIALSTGFSGSSAFARAFRRWHGQTPSDYRSTAQTSRPAAVH
ncbi:MAG: helix-turn-helix domain-containing protein [Candidatus Binatia bacterium]